MIRHLRVSRAYPFDDWLQLKQFHFTGEMMPTNQAQIDVYEALRASLPTDLVSWEWSIARNAEDTFADVRAYAPRLNIAIGPFNTSFQNRYEDIAAIQSYRPAVISRIYDAVRTQNNGDFSENPNPRCTVGIEIECTTSSKHILGGMTNASLLSRIAIIVGNPNSIGKIQRIHAYVRKLIEVEKADTSMFCEPRLL